MRIWITYPYDDTGVRVGTLGPPDHTGWRPLDYGLWDGRVWGWEAYEGVMWHRTRKAAVKKAVEHRAERLAKATQEAAHLRALPLIAAPVTSRKC